MSTFDWSTQKLKSIIAWYGMVNFDPSAPAREDIVLVIDPSSAKGRILATFQDLFDVELEPRDAANRLRDLVLRPGEKEQTMTAWQFMIGSIARASHSFEYDTLVRLVDTVLELSKMSDSLPYHPIFGENSPSIKPGDLAFSKLPGLGLPLFESVQGVQYVYHNQVIRKLTVTSGPRQYICNLQEVTFQARFAAQRRFKNISTFVAMLTRIYLLGVPCRSMDFTHVGLPVISLALEGDILEGEYQDRATVSYFRMGDPAILYLPAAIQWINVAGREMFQDASLQTTLVSSSTKIGPLWRPAEGDRLWAKNRWEFWQKRLIYLAERGDLGPDLSNDVIKAADNLAEILEYR
jgi:hypothetical protein